MQVILMEKIRNLGNLGSQVVVKPGYGRNYLLPSGKAVSATKDNIAKFEARKAELEKIASENKAVAEARATQLANLIVTIAAKAGDEGKLFGSIGARDIAEAITQQGVAVIKSEIRLPNGLIRNVGEYPIELQLHTDVEATITVTVIPE